MKLIIRADDVGYSKVCNIGAFETLDQGVVTSMDIMLDTPGAIDALNRLKNYPWISIGWHTHFWGSPVLGGDAVPTLFDSQRDGFRKDLTTASDVSYEEALAELRAEMNMCLDILGRTPDVGATFQGGTPFARAMDQVNKEFHLVVNYMGMDQRIPLELEDQNETVFKSFSKIYASDERWKERNIFMRGLLEYCVPLKANPRTKDGWTDSLCALEQYDPIRYYTQDESKLLELSDDSITVHAWHPGYIDYYVLRKGDYSAGAHVFKEVRPIDVHALCSNEVKDWIRSNKIELINLRDALYGTNEYQNHLRNIGSDLAV